MPPKPSNNQKTNRSNTNRNNTNRNNHVATNRNFTNSVPRSPTNSQRITVESLHQPTHIAPEGHRANSPLRSPRPLQQQNPIHSNATISSRLLAPHDIHSYSFLTHVADHASHNFNSAVADSLMSHQNNTRLVDSSRNNANNESDNINHTNNENSHFAHDHRADSNNNSNAHADGGSNRAGNDGINSRVSSSGFFSFPQDRASNIARDGDRENHDNDLTSSNNNNTTAEGGDRINSNNVNFRPGRPNNSKRVKKSKLRNISEHDNTSNHHNNDSNNNNNTGRHDSDPVSDWQISDRDDGGNNNNTAIDRGDRISYSNADFQSGQPSNQWYAKNSNSHAMDRDSNNINSNNNTGRRNSDLMWDWQIGGSDDDNNNNNTAENRGDRINYNNVDFQSAQPDNSRHGKNSNSRNVKRGRDSNNNDSNNANNNSNNNNNNAYNDDSINTDDSNHRRYSLRQRTTRTSLVFEPTHVGFDIDNYLNVPHVAHPLPPEEIPAWRRTLNSDILRYNLIRANVPDSNNPIWGDDIGNQAHHIIEYSDKAAGPARAWLGIAGIDLNSAANGVFLPSGKRDDAGDASVHRGSHVREYANGINDRLRAAIRAAGLDPDGTGTYWNAFRKRNLRIALLNAIHRERRRLLTQNVALNNSSDADYEPEQIKRWKKS